MTKGLRATVLALTALLFACDQGQSVAEIEWAKATAHDHSNAYRVFLDHFCESEFADEAIRRLCEKSPPSAAENAAFEAAARVDMPFAYTDFTEADPDSVLAYKARRELSIGFGSLTATQDTTIPLPDLATRYHWNGAEVLWMWWDWGDDVTGVEAPGGDRTLLRSEATTPENGLPLDFSSGSTGFGQLCVGNLQIEGRCVFENDGITLAPGAKLTYPKR